MGLTSVDVIVTILYETGDEREVAIVGGLSKRFDRAVAAGDLPSGSDTDAPAHLVLTVNDGLTVQATTARFHQFLIESPRLLVKR